MSIFLTCLLIFFARICDVTIGTLRIIFVSRGMKYFASFMGFFEILIWIVVVAKVMGNEVNMYAYLAYAAGFSVGNFIGISIENKIAMGNLIVRVITGKDSYVIISDLRQNGYLVTDVDGQGRDGPVKLLFSVVKRKQLQKFLDIIHRYNPKAFYTVEDVRQVNAPYYHKPLRRFGRGIAKKK